MNESDLRSNVPPITDHRVPYTSQHSASEGETRNTNKISKPPKTEILQGPNGKTISEKTKKNPWKKNKVERKHDNNSEKKLWKNNEIRSAKIDLSAQRQHLREVYGPQFISSLLWFPCLMKTERNFRILIVHSNLWLFPDSYANHWGELFTLTRTSHRNEMELNVWSTKRSSSPLRLRICQNETFKKRYASWIHMIANIVVNKST